VELQHSEESERMCLSQSQATPLRSIAQELGLRMAPAEEQVVVPHGMHQMSLTMKAMAPIMWLPALTMWLPALTMWWTALIVVGH